MCVGSWTNLAGNVRHGKHAASATEELLTERASAKNARAARQGVTCVGRPGSPWDNH